MIKAKGYRVLVKPDAIVKETKGGIVLPTDEKLEKTGIQRGVVVSIGPTAWKAFREVDDRGMEHNGQPQVKVGDYVLFARHAGRFVYDPYNPSANDEHEFLIMNDEDILAVIEEGKTLIPVNECQTYVTEHEKVLK